MIMLEGGYRIQLSYPGCWILEKNNRGIFVKIDESCDIVCVIKCYLKRREIERFNEIEFKLTENDAKGVVHNTPKGKDFIESINRCLKDMEVME